MVNEVEPVPEAGTLQQRRDRGVGFQTPPVAAGAQPPVEADGGVTQLAGKIPQQLPAGHNGRADADVDEQKHKVPALPCASLM